MRLALTVSFEHHTNDIRSTNPQEGPAARACNAGAAGGACGVVRATEQGLQKHPGQGRLYPVPVACAAMSKKRKGNTPPVTPEEAKQMVELIDNAILEYSGVGDTLEQAIGMYMIGRHFGWKVLVLMHNKRTIRKYEEILGISIRDAFPEVGPDAPRSMGFKAAEVLSNFWKAVSGDEKIEGRKEIAKG